jgi:hypothetical protein
VNDFVTMDYTYEDLNQVSPLTSLIICSVLKNALRTVAVSVGKYVDLFPQCIDMCQQFRNTAAREVHSPKERI